MNLCSINYVICYSHVMVVDLLGHYDNGILVLVVLFYLLIYFGEDVIVWGSNQSNLFY